MTTLRSGTFSIESVFGPYAGYTEGRAWNGWACPSFTTAVAQQLLADYNAADAATIYGTYDAATDTSRLSMKRTISMGSRIRCVANRMRWTDRR